MSIDERISGFMPVAGATTAAIVFLTTYRTGELRALLSDNAATLTAYTREAVICTMLPLLTLLLIVFGLDLALDTVRALTGPSGFNASQAAFVLFVALLLFLLVYQVFLAASAWSQWQSKRTND